MKYYSQYGQDEFIDNYFNQKQKGIFLDIGANDGIDFSNTYFLEKERNWQGICFEPIKLMFEKLKINRKCECINACVSSEEGDLDFCENTGYTTMLSGLIKTFDNHHRNRIQIENQKFGGTSTIKKVQSVNINKVLEERKIIKIDYCSIDTEGSEIDIIQSIDFTKIDIKIMSIENDRFGEKLSKIMNNSGYILIKKLSGDDIYLKESV